MKWEKIGKTVSAEGSTITYELSECPAYRIESRKRHIPHANREGTWDHTTYVVIRGLKELAEKNALRDARAYAEKEYQKEVKGGK